MKRTAVLAAAFAAALPVLAAPAPARANTFCPVTVAAAADLATVVWPGVYGVLLDVDLGDTRSMRLRIDTDRTRYALDFNDLPLMVFTPLRLTRYFVVPTGERVVGAWVQSTGLSPAERLDCPLTAPWSPSAPAPATPAEQQAAQRDRRTLIDGYGSKMTPLAPVAFGAASPATCAQPYAPPHPVAPIHPAFPPEARGVNATGVVGLRVDVDDAGTVAGAAVVRSSGFAPLDRAALETAKRAKYVPAVYACRPIASSYTFATGFGT